jgi:hypothetical protein
MENDRENEIAVISMHETASEAMTQIRTRSVSAMEERKIRMIFSAITVFDAFGVPVILRYTMYRKGSDIPARL